MVREHGMSNAVLKTLIITFAQIQRQRPKAASILSMMTFLDRQNIPNYLLQDEGESASSFARCINALLAFSVVPSSAEGTSFSFNSLVSVAARYWLSDHGQLKH